MKKSLQVVICQVIHLNSNLAVDNNKNSIFSSVTIV